MTRTAEMVRAEIGAAMDVQPRTRRTRERVEELQWELDRLTATEAINARRSEMGLVPWTGAQW